MLAENVLFRAVSKKAENVSRIRFSANSCEQKTKEAPFERGFLLTKAEGCFANSQRLSANRIPLKFAFPGGFEPPTFRLGGGRTILLCNGNVFNFWLVYWLFGHPASRPVMPVSAHSLLTLADTCKFNLPPFRVAVLLEISRR